MANELYALLGASPTDSDDVLRKAYFRALRKHPGDKDALRHQEIRQAYRVLGEPSSRRDYDASQRGGGEVDRLLQEGSTALENEDHGRAERLFKRALAISPDSVTARSQLVRLSFRKGDHQHALQLQQQLAVAHPDDLSVQSEQGWLCLAVVTIATENEPERMTPAHRRTLIAAQDAFDECIRLEPSNRVGYMGRARIDYYRNRFDAAKRWAQRAVDCDDRHDFEDFDSFLLITECQVLTGRMDDAVRTMAKIHEVVPEQEEVRNYAAERLGQMGLMLMSVKAFGLATRVFQQCSRIAPEHEGIAELVEANLMAAKAREELEAMQDDSKMPRPVFGLGVLGVMLYTGEFESEQAKDDFFHGIMEALDDLTPRSISVALGRLQSRYRNVWSCNPKLFEEVRRVARQADAGTSGVAGRGSPVSRSAQHGGYSPVEQGCFAADTMVTTPYGDVRIATIRKGDVVLGFDPNHGPVWSAVRGVRAVTCDFVRIAVGRKDIQVSPLHLFLTSSRGLVPARDLFASDEVALVTSAGSSVVWVSVREVETLLTRSMAYNLYLEDASFYFAGGVCACSFGWMPEARDGLRRLHAVLSGHARAALAALAAFTEVSSWIMHRLRLIPAPNTPAAPDTRRGA